MGGPYRPNESDDVTILVLHLSPSTVSKRRGSSEVEQPSALEMSLHPPLGSVSAALDQSKHVGDRKRVRGGGQERFA